MHRSAGPMGPDVKSKLQKDPAPEYHELETKALALEAAEHSARTKLQTVLNQKAKMKAKAAPKKSSEPEIQVMSATPSGEKGYPAAAPKKSSKRENAVPPEAQEIPDDDS